MTAWDTMAKYVDQLTGHKMRNAYWGDSEISIICDLLQRLINHEDKRPTAKQIEKYSNEACDCHYWPRNGVADVLTKHHVFCPSFNAMCEIYCLDKRLKTR